MTETEIPAHSRRKILRTRISRALNNLYVANSELETARKELENFEALQAQSCEQLELDGTKR